MDISALPSVSKLNPLAAASFLMRDQITWATLRIM